MDAVASTAPDLGAAPVAANVASASWELAAAYRLRYDVYIEEQGKPYPDANHALREWHDPLDVHSETVIARSGHQIVGTVRASWFDAEETRDRYAAEFELSRFGAVPEARIAVCGRLAVAPPHRTAVVRDLLFTEIYRRGLRRNTVLCFASCVPILRRMFRKYGFREYANPLADPVVGPLHRLVLVLDDIEHLERVWSPFLAIAREHRLSPGVRPWLSQIIESRMEAPCE